MGKYMGEMLKFKFHQIIYVQSKNGHHLQHKISVFMCA